MAKSKIAAKAAKSKKAPAQPRKTAKAAKASKVKSSAAKKAAAKPAAQKKASPKASKAGTKKSSAPKARLKSVAKSTASKAANKKTTNKKSATPKKSSAGKLAPARAMVSAGGKVISMAKAREQKEWAAKIEKTFSPLDNRVVVQKEGAANRTAGGLYIPDMVAASERPNQGKVLAVGPGHRDKKGRLRPLDVKVGDTVMFGSFTGSEVNLDGVEVLLLREDEIIAVVKS